jgi:peptidoglycan/LPS O-acetylase OafA/YrhL
VFGAHGVEIFFVISGFCLAYPTLQRVANGASYSLDYGAFMARRLVRILPPFWVALAVLIVLSLSPAWRVIGSHGATSASYTIADIAREASLFDRGPLHNGSFWSLSVELRWYFVFPLALWLFVHAKRAFILLGLAAWMLYFQTRLSALDVEVLPAFLMGIIAADAFVRRAAWTRWAPHAFLCCVAIVLVWPGEPGARTPIWQLTSFAFVLSAVGFTPMQRVLSWKPLAAIGVASYSIYLVHEPFIVWLDALNSPGLVTIAAALGVGALFWLLVERPLTKPEVRRRMVAFTEDLLHLAMHITGPELLAILVRRGRREKLASLPTAQGARPERA